VHGECPASTPKKHADSVSGAVILQALAAARKALYQQSRVNDADPSQMDVSTDPPSLAQQHADALALLAETALHHGLIPAHRANGIRWWSTLTPQCWPTRMRQ